MKEVVMIGGFPRGMLMAAALAAALVCAESCAQKLPPNVSPEGAAAIKGDAVVKAADGAVTKADQGMDAGTIPVNIGVPVVKVGREIGLKAVDLAGYLKVIDTAKTVAEATDAKGKADAILKAIQDAETTILADLVKDPASKKVVDDLLAKVRDAIKAVQDLVKPAAA